MAQLLSQARSSAGPCYGVPVKRLITCVKPLTRVCVRSSTNSNKANVTTVAADAETAKSTVTEDAYYLASKRLHTLLQDAALSNKDTVPIDFIDACNVEERLTLFANLSAMAIMLSFIICLLFGEYEPLGYLRCDSYTLEAAVHGMMYAVPLVLCSAASRSSLTKPFPVLKDMHEMQHDLIEHFTAGMTVPQVCILVAFILLPSLLLLLPASKAVLVWSGAFLQQCLLQSWASVVHIRPLHIHALGQVLPPVLSSYLAGLVSASCFNVRPKQIEVVKDALRNADAYFRLISSQQPRQPLATPHRPPAASGAAPPTVFASSTLAVSSLEEECEEAAGESSSTPPGSQAAADAFRDVAMVWFLSRRRVARLAYILTSLDVAYLGVIWQATGNLATPTAAAFSHAVAEVWLGEWQAKAAKVTGRQQLP